MEARVWEMKWESPWGHRHFINPAGPMARGRKGANGKRRRTPGLSTLSRPLASPIACLYTYLPLSRSLRDPHQESVSLLLLLPSPIPHRNLVAAAARRSSSLEPWPPLWPQLQRTWAPWPPSGPPPPSSLASSRAPPPCPPSAAPMAAASPWPNGCPATPAPPTSMAPPPGQYIEWAGWLAFVGGWVGCCLWLCVFVVGGREFGVHLGAGSGSHCVLTSSFRDGLAMECIF